MQNTSELLKTILKNPLCVLQNKVTIAGKDYFDDKIESISVSGSMFSSAGPCIGSAVSRSIEITLKTEGSYIPRSAEIKVYIRLALLNNSGAVGSASEWISKGVFFIDTRQPDDADEFLTIHGYDAMLKGELPLLDQSSGETGLWPQPMSAVASACAAKMGVEIDSRTVISSDYTIGYPTDYTCRELLRHIAAAHGGNWIITDDGKLRLIVLGDLDSYNPIQLGRNVSDFSAPPAFSPFTKLTLWIDDETGFTSGNDTGRSIEGDCPWATQEMCDAVLSIINGYQYVPYTATDALIDPAAEIGDSVVVNGKFSVIASMDATLDHLYTATISAPADEEIDHEFPYQPKSDRTFNRKLAKTKSEIMVKLDSITLKVVGADGTVSEIKLTDNGQIDLTGFATFKGLSDGTTVIDGGCLKTGTITANNISVDGALKIVSGEKQGGYLGYGYGNDGASDTDGVIMASSKKDTYGSADHYVICTGSGVRMQSGRNSIYCVDSGVYKVVNGVASEIGEAVFG